MTQLFLTKIIFLTKNFKNFIYQKTSPPYAVMTSMQTTNFETLLKHLVKLLKPFWLNTAENLVKIWTNPGSEWNWKLLMAGSKTNLGSERKLKFEVALTKWIQVVNESESCTRQVVKVANPGSCDKMNSPGNLIFHLPRL